jgi:DNA-binding LytR/AlgR family response regulator
MNSYKYLFFLLRKFFYNIFGIITFPFQLLLWLFVYVTSYQNDNENGLLNEEHVETIPLVAETEAETETEKEMIKTVSVKTGKRLHIIPISEIVCIQAYGDYVNIMTLQGVYLKEQTLKYFNEHLPEDQFLRVHRSYMVNLHAIETIERYGRDQYLLLLKNKEKIKATLEGYRKLRERLKL